MDQEEEIERYASHQLQNSFLSTIDHLPCDIVRSLWLIQSCNIEIDKLKQELHTLLQNYQTDQQHTLLQDEISRVYALKHSIRHLYDETIQEGKTLNNQLIIHKLHLQDEVTQLKMIKDKLSSDGVSKDADDDKEAQNQLRKQLKQHYKEHPLVSQVEAVEQQKHWQKRMEKEMEKEKEKSKNKGVGSGKSGIKLVLKIPKQDKVLKPRGKNVVKKSSGGGQSKSKGVATRAVNVVPKRKEKKQARKEMEVIPLADYQVEDDEDDENKTYCFCHQPSLGDMIACDNETSCPNGEWFHYKCVGLLNRVEALKYTTGKIPWYCSEGCRQIGEAERAKQQEMKKRKRRRKW